MKLFSQSIISGQPIATEFAFGKPATEGHVTVSNNRNPHLRWSDAPPNTLSFAVICVDPDVPASVELVNLEDRTIPAGHERCDFFHWVMIDVPASVSEIAAGSCSDQGVMGGKTNPPGPGRQGLNDYTGFMGDGDYFGYDGPWPPFNDERLHHYHFRVYALDTERLNIDGPFDGPQAMAAIQPHVLANAELIGSYTLNPLVKQQ